MQDCTEVKQKLPVQVLMFVEEALGMKVTILWYPTLFSQDVQRVTLAAKRSRQGTAKVSISTASVSSSLL